ncbi:threonylcarbamoyl-AMP synthase-like [Paramacrobiotus metropolitanus]|uniref:threonylcarbamoyl-AMP synthase-like n=1 Tax=Paramacrobiotus metropolitanus TaxID=2943436 RepID=UPI0024457129|nr:threonylcarbamoyl-AMP synthase-like [Paramacrobiotus metropolitanus]
MVMGTVIKFSCSFLCGLRTFLSPNLNQFISRSRITAINTSFDAFRGLSTARQQAVEMTGDPGISNVVKWSKDSAKENEVIQRAVNALQKGKLIAVPTDTIYGIAGLAQNSCAVSQIYKVKGRDPSKPIAICVDCVEAVSRWAKTDMLPEKFLNSFFPGPVTGVFERQPSLNPELNPETSIIGVRIPDHSFIRRLAEACGEPIALTSANKSGGESSLIIEEFKYLWPHLDLVVDAGCLAPDTISKQTARLGSTVVDLSKPGFFRIIRPGSAYDTTVRLLQLYGVKEFKDYE